MRSRVESLNYFEIIFFFCSTFSFDVLPFLSSAVNFMDANKCWSTSSRIEPQKIKTNNFQNLRH